MAQPSATLTLFVLDQTQQSWSQSSHTLTHEAEHPARPTYNLSPLPSQVTHLGWGGTWWDTTQKQNFQASIPSVDINFAVSSKSFTTRIAANTSSQSTNIGHEQISAHTCSWLA